MAGCRFLWQALRQAKSRPAYSAPFCCNIGLGQTNARGLGFGENSPISSLCHGRTSGREQVKLSVEETRKLLKVISLEGLKRGIEENGKECVSYKELLDMCKKWSFKATDEEASCIAKELEEAGVVLNFRGRVYLQPDQVARAFGHVMPLEVPSEKDPHRQEFLQLKKQKLDSFV
ncbi:hypothetical protein SUGI_0243930 [Cryptomeria japonica]|nr:hypothetical protein SUGI_0243930 [Cryptomeria japonica]